MIEWRIDVPAHSSCNCAYTPLANSDWVPPSAAAIVPRWTGMSAATSVKLISTASLAGLYEWQGAIFARSIVCSAAEEPHRIRIVLPAGIEFTATEIASASTKVSNPIVLDFKDTYGQFNAIHHADSGAVHHDI
ncbi:hypothetical protein [Brucella cytisi]|uniref:hypothetical protein n=1 Tax=Brucella cytisi TaxID=407152 RepID=UPI00169916BF|nr:hypothetical protein [Brucella cytisi]